MNFRKRDNYNFYLRNLLWNWRGQKLEWGKYDCGLLAIKSFEAITGELPPIHLPEHRSVKEALQYQKDHCSVESFFERHIDDSVLDVVGEFRQDGDFVIFETDDLWISTGISYSGMIACFGDDGLHLRIKEVCAPIKRVFRIKS